jgi:hypothetical protein
MERQLIDWLVRYRSAASSGQDVYTGDRRDAAERGDFGAVILEMREESNENR